MGSVPVYLWTLLMSHCNGWTFTWGIAARRGTNVCLHNTTAFDIYKSISMHKVTHMCCAPIIFNILLDQSKPKQRPDIKSPVQIVTGGAPPPASLLEQIEPLGFHVTHAYGLTEATGPALACEWQAKWNQLPRDEQAKLKARQGISIVTLADVDVKELRCVSVSSRSSSLTTPPFSALSLAAPESSTWPLPASSIKSMILKSMLSSFLASLFFVHNKKGKKKEKECG